MEKKGKWWCFKNICIGYMNIPQHKPRDKEKYRQQYLANLQLENSNNTLNLNASKMYKATGASSQVASTMTGAEKLAGLEGLKQIAKDHLVSFRFANPLSAQEAVDGLTPEDIKFLNEYAQFIGSDFKGRNVPARIIINYIKKLRKKMEETEGVDYGIQQSSGSGILLSGSGSIYLPGDIQEITMRSQQAGFTENVISEIFTLMNKINRQASGINLERAKREGPERYALALKANSAFRENAPTIEQLLQMISDDDAIAIISALQGAGRIDDYVASVGAEASNGPVFANPPIGEGESGVEGIGGVGDSIADRREDQDERIRLAVESFSMNSPEVKFLMLEQLGVNTADLKTSDELNNAYESALTARLLGTSPSQPFSPSPSQPFSPLSPASSLSATPLGSPEEEFGQLGELPSRVNAPNAIQMGVQIRQGLESYIQQVEQSGGDGLYPGNIPDAIYDDIYGFYQIASNQTYIEPPNFIKSILENEGLLNRNANDAIFRWLGDSIIDLQIASPSSATTDSPATFGSPSTIGSEGTPQRLPGNPKPKPPPPVSAGNETGKGRGLVGKGVGRVSPRSALHRVEKYDKPKPYRQFGRHIIHRRKLDDGIMMIKYPSGAKHHEMPTQKISEDLTKVLKEMADGRMPQYHHFEGMSVKDKELLHHIVRHTQFQDLQVPPPDKEAMDKEIDRFDIIKGEIEAGNDNKEIIKEFKVMLLKFMRQGRIPKAQVNEIMEHLLMMGH